jgi:hypothetical protein
MPALSYGPVPNVHNFLDRMTIEIVQRFVFQFRLPRDVHCLAFVGVELHFHVITPSLNVIMVALK